MQTLELPASVQGRACFAQFIGALAVEQAYFEQAIVQINKVGMPAIWEANEKRPAGLYNPNVLAIAAALATQGHPVTVPKAGDAQMDEAGIPAYAISRGTAVIPVNGPLSKQSSSLNSMFGGSNTVGMRKALALAMADERVERVMFHIDSPGGTVAGTGDLGDDIFAASHKKPIASYIEDMGTSAAYWVASQTAQVYASPYANVGSIGVIWTVYDTSEAYQKDGIKVHAIMSNPGKAFAVDGMPITKQQMAKMQAHVDATYSHFLGAVARGRGVSFDAARAMSGDADIYPAAQAQQKGLIDGVMSFGDALGKFANEPAVRLTALPAQPAAPAAQTLTMQVIETAVGFDGSAASSGAGSFNGTVSTGGGGGVGAAVSTIGSDVSGAASAVGSGFSTPSGIVGSEESSVTPEPETAGQPAKAAPVTISAEEHKLLQAKAAEGSEALKIVKAMQEAQAKAAASALAGERDRLMADYGLSKEQVEACPDAASLRALESVARSVGAKRTGADPKVNAASAKDEGADLFAQQDAERIAWLKTIALPGANVASLEE